MARFCSECGNPIPENASFCPECGTPVWKEEVSEEIQFKKKKRISKSALIASISGALCAACVLCFIFLFIRPGVTCTCTFEANAEDADIDSVPEVQTVKYRGKASCPAFPLRDGYWFNGWYTDPECTSEYDFHNSVKKDITLYAGWLSEDDPNAGLTEEEYNAIIAAGDKIGEAVSSYTSEDGYVSEENLAEVLDKVEQVTQQLKRDGNVTYFEKSDSGVYMEFFSKIAVVYSPSSEDTASGKGDVSVTGIQPYQNGNLDQLSDATLGTIAAAMSTQSETVTANGPLNNDEVTSSSLQNLGTMAGLIWNGHGKYEGSKVILATNERVNDFEGVFRKLEPNTVMLYDQGFYVGITAGYVKKYMTMEQGFVYLSACQSGHTDQMAEAFASIGAETVFINRGTDDIQKAYTQTMMNAIISYMAAQQDEIYHTAADALELVHAGMAAKYDGYQNTCFRRNDDGSYIQYDCRPEIYGVGEYTFCSGIKAVLSTEIPDLDLNDIRLELSNKKNVDFRTDEQECYFNKLDPGTYDLNVYYQDELIQKTSNITVSKHRFTTINVNIKNKMIDLSFAADDGTELKNLSVTAKDASGKSLEVTMGTSSNNKPTAHMETISGNVEISVTADDCANLTDKLEVTDDTSREYTLVKRKLLTVHVSDVESGEALSDASVTITDGSSSWTANATANAGEYSVKLFPGTYHISCSKTNYSSAEYDLKDFPNETEVSLSLKKELLLTGTYVGEFNGTTTYELQVISQNGNQLEVIIEWYNLRMGAGIPQTSCTLDGYTTVVTGNATGGHNTNGNVTFTITFDPSGGKATLSSDGDSLVLYKK